MIARQLSIEKIDPENCILLVGAGISLDPPSHIPLAIDIRKSLITSLLKENPQFIQQFEGLFMPPPNQVPYQGPFASTRFELLIDWVNYFIPDLFSKLENLDYLGSPNLWHYHIATAMRDGAIVLTTNWDTRIETACLALGYNPEIFVVGERKRSWKKPTIPNLIKLHGSFPIPGKSSIYQPIGTLMQLAKFGLGYNSYPDLTKILRQVSNRKHLVVCGYSGWDSFDVMPLIEENLKNVTIYWHVWNSKPEPLVSIADKFDVLKDVQTNHTPADVFLASYKPEFEPSAFKIHSNTASFFQLIFPTQLIAESTTTSSAVEKELAELLLDRAEVQAEIRDIFDSIDTIGAEEIEIIMSRIANAYNTDDYLGQAERFAEEQAGKSDFQNTEESTDTWTQKVLVLMDEGRYIEAADEFEAVVTQNEADHANSPPHVHADNLLFILDSCFWGALKQNQVRNAWRIARRIRRIAKKHRSIWGIIHADYLEANIYHHWASQPVSKTNRLRRDPLFYQIQAQRLLNQVVRYRLMIPRLDMVVDALRLLRYMETDSQIQLSYEFKIDKWAGLLPDCEEKLLALFDLVRWNSERREKIAVENKLKELEKVVGSLPKLPAATLYLACAECHLAYLNENVIALRKAIDRFRKISVDPIYFQDAFTAELNRFQLLCRNLEKELTE